MKKIFALIVPMVLSLFSPAFAKVEPLAQAEKPDQFIQMDFGRTMNRGIERNQTWAGFQYSFDWQPFFGFAGFEFEPNYYDITLRTGFLPFAGYHENGVWRFGATTAWHLQRKEGSYSQRDLLQEIEVRWISTRGLTFTARTGFVFKAALFDKLDDFCIKNFDPVAYAQIDKVWKSGFELFTSIGTYNLYRYPLFFCPQWNFGAAWNFKKTLRLGALAEIGMTDFYSSVAYFNHVLVKCNLRIMF